MKKLVPRSESSLARWTRRQSVTQLQKWALDCEKQNGGGDVNAEFNAEQRGHGGEREVMIEAKSADKMEGASSIKGFSDKET